MDTTAEAIEAWEKAARFSMLIRANGKWSEAIVDKHYERALAYCDCIQHFTNDQDKWDCYDRLLDQVLRRIELGIPFKELI